MVTALAALCGALVVGGLWLAMSSWRPVPVAKTERHAQDLQQAPAGGGRLDLDGSRGGVGHSALSFRTSAVSRGRISKRSPTIP